MTAWQCLFVNSDDLELKDSWLEPKPRSAIFVSADMLLHDERFCRWKLKSKNQALVKYIQTNHL